MPLRRAAVSAGAALLLYPLTLSAEAQDPRMVEIVGLIRDGKQAEAVGHADAMIAQFAAAQHEPGVSYFCNRDGGGVANLGAAAGHGKKVDLAPEAWCEALFAKGFALSGLKRYDEAAQVLGQAVAMDPTNPHFLNQYGDVLRLRGDAVAAIVQYGRAFELTASDDAQMPARMANRALRGMALASESKGDLPAAQGYYEQLLRRDATDAAARAKLAEIVKARAAEK